MAAVQPALPAFPLPLRLRVPGGSAAVGTGGGAEPRAASQEGKFSGGSSGSCVAEGAGSAVCSVAWGKSGSPTLRAGRAWPAACGCVAAACLCAPLPLTSTLRVALCPLGGCLHRWLPATTAALGLRTPGSLAAVAPARRVEGAASLGGRARVPPVPHPTVSSASLALIGPPAVGLLSRNPTYAKVALAYICAGASSLLFLDYIYCDEEGGPRAAHAPLHCAAAMVTLRIPRVFTSACDSMQLCVPGVGKSSPREWAWGAVGHAEGWRKRKAVPGGRRQSCLFPPHFLHLYPCRQ